MQIIVPEKKCKKITIGDEPFVVAELDMTAEEIILAVLKHEETKEPILVVLKHEETKEPVGVFKHD